MFSFHSNIPGEGVLYSFRGVYGMSQVLLCVCGHQSLQGKNGPGSCFAPETGSCSLGHATKNDLKSYNRKRGEKVQVAPPLFVSFLPFGA